MKIEEMTDTEQVLHWKNLQVLNYLETYKMNSLIDIFKAHRINGRDFITLNENDITNTLNITNIHMRKKLIRHVNKLKNISDSDCIFRINNRLYCKDSL